MVRQAPAKGGFSRGEPGGVPQRERAMLHNANNRTALVSTFGVFGLSACAYRPPPKESLSAVQLGLGHERRSLWGLACKVVRTRPYIGRSIRETGHSGMRVRDEGTAILWGDAISAPVRQSFSGGVLV